MTLLTRILDIHGMHCEGCETAIENAVSLLPGVQKVSADYHGDMATIRFDDDKISLEEIIFCIEKSGYQARLNAPNNAVKTVSRQQGRQDKFSFKSIKQIVVVLVVLAGVFSITWLDSWFMDHAEMPKLNRDISFGLLVLIGFLTSFHCVGMCGPFIIGYSAKAAETRHKPHFAHIFYGLGKTLSYTAIGALFGAFGAVIAFTPYTQGVVGVAAGVFLILYGLHMLELFPVLSHFQIAMPRFVRRFIGDEYRKHSNPFVIGLLNGLMIICGPLQAMYIMAAGTGDWMEGAKILFFFGIGTLPLLMGFGFLTSLLSTNLTPKLLRASGYVIIVLGAIMLNRGLTVTGAGFDVNTMITRFGQTFSPTQFEKPLNSNEQIIEMDVVAKGFVPNKFTLRKGVPVKWVINGKDVNECNKAIVVPQYHLEINIKPGKQIVEFTPPETGIVPWSCWMGMIPGSFIVVDNSISVQSGDINVPKAGQVVKEGVLKFYKQLIEKLQVMFYQRSN